MSKILVLDAKVTVLRGNDHYWRVILELDRKGAWTVSDVDALSNGDRHSIRDFVQRLEKAGYAHVVEERRGRGAVVSRFYRLLKTSREAPRLTRNGMAIEEPLQETLWRSMKLLKTFTSAQLAAAAATPARPADEVATDTYCRRLTAAGVLQVTTPAKRGRGATKQTYRLAMASLGPLAPRVLRSHLVYDPNAKAILGVADAREAS